MFGRNKKQTATDPTPDVAAFIVRTLLGTVDTGLSSGLAFTKAFAAHRSKPESDSRAQLVQEIATQLVAEDATLAAQLVDALAAKVGR